MTWTSEPWLVRTSTSTSTESPPSRILRQSRIEDGLIAQSTSTYQPAENRSARGRQSLVVFISGEDQNPNGSPTTSVKSPIPLPTILSSSHEEGEPVHSPCTSIASFPTQSRSRTPLRHGLSRQSSSVMGCSSGNRLMGSQTRSGSSQKSLDLS